MSVTVDYFFNYELSLDLLASEVNRALGSALTHFGWTDEYSCGFCGVELTLATVQGLENDRDLNFEDFNYWVGLRTAWGNAEARPIQLPVMLTIVYALHLHLGLTGMLVFDIGTLLARYEEREMDGYGKRLFDVILGTPFLNFSSHLHIVQQRLPERWRSLAGNSNQV